MERIPVYPLISSDFSENLLIEGVRINLRFMFNSQTEFWMLNEYLEPDTGNRATGIKVKPQYPLTENIDTSLKGCLMVGRTDKAVGEQITYESFGLGWDLFYLTEEEYDLWKDTVGI
jgi:hypothetical protein